MKTLKVQEVIERIRAGGLTATELIGHFSHPSALVRVNAMEVLASCGEQTLEAVEAFRRVALDPGNRTRLLGVLTVADIAVACLLRIGSSAADETANELIALQKEPHRSDLVWYLRSEGLARETASPTTT